MKRVWRWTVFGQGLIGPFRIGCCYLTASEMPAVVFLSSRAIWPVLRRYSWFCRVFRFSAPDVSTNDNNNDDSFITANDDDFEVDEYDCIEDLQSLPQRSQCGYDSGTAHPRTNPHRSREDNLVPDDRPLHPVEREVRGRPPTAKNGRPELPDPQGEAEHRRGRPILRLQQPRTHHPPRCVRHGAGGGGKALFTPSKQRR